MKNLSSKILCGALVSMMAVPVPAFSAPPIPSSNYNMSNEYSAIINKERAQQKKGFWIDASSFNRAQNYQSFIPTPPDQVPNQCRSGGSSQAPETKLPIRTVFFMGTATSSYTADQHEPTATTITQERHFPLTCSLSIVNWSETTQYVRWGMQMTMRQQGTNRDSLANSTQGVEIYKALVSRGSKFNFRTGDPSSLANLSGTTLNPTKETWMQVAPGEAIELKVDLGLPTGLPSAYRSFSQIVPEICSGFIQSCDRPNSQYKGELMVSGEMQYVQDAPSNIRIHYATNLREKAGDAGRVVTFAPNCFKDEGRSLNGYESISAGEVAGASAAKGTPPTYGSNEWKLGGFSSVATMPTDTWLGDWYVRWNNVNPALGHNTSLTLSQRSAARLFATRHGQATAAGGWTAEKLAALRVRCASSDQSPINARNTSCNNLAAFDAYHEENLKGAELSPDLIEDVGANRFRGLAPSGQECFSYNDLNVEEGRPAFNKSLTTGEFPMHIGSIGIMVNSGQAF